MPLRGLPAPTVTQAPLAAWTTRTYVHQVHASRWNSISARVATVCATPTHRLLTPAPGTLPHHKTSYALRCTHSRQPTAQQHRETRQVARGRARAPATTVSSGSAPLCRARVRRCRRTLRYLSAIAVLVLAAAMATSLLPTVAAAMLLTMAARTTTVARVVLLALSTTHPPLPEVSVRLHKHVPLELMVLKAMRMLLICPQITAATELTLR